jgi:hypothetical protein
MEKKLVKEGSKKLRHSRFDLVCGEVTLGQIKVFCSGPIGSSKKKKKVKNILQ